MGGRHDMISTILYKREEGVDASDVLGTSKLCGAPIRDPRPKRWRCLEDAKADMELMRTGKLPTVTIPTLEGDPQLITYFPMALNALVKDDDGAIRPNPEWLSAPIEMAVFFIPDAGEGETPL